MFGAAIARCFSTEALVTSRAGDAGGFAGELQRIGAARQTDVEGQLRIIRQGEGQIRMNRPKHFPPDSNGPLVIRFGIRKLALQPKIMGQFEITSCNVGVVWVEHGQPCLQRPLEQRLGIGNPALCFEVGRHIAEANCRQSILFAIESLPDRQGPGIERSRLRQPPARIEIVGNIIVTRGSTPVFGAHLLTNGQGARKKGCGIFMTPLGRQIECQAVVACRDIRIVGAQHGKTNLQGMVVERLGLKVAAACREVACNIVFNPGKFGIVIVHRCAADFQGLVIERLCVLIPALAG